MASNAALTRRSRQSKADPKASSELLEVGGADRRLDALIEEEQRARSLDPGPRRSSSTPPLEGPRGEPASLRPLRPLEDSREAAHRGESSLRSVRPSVPQHPPQGAGDDGGVHGGLAALHDAVQRTYQALQQALTGPLQGHGQLHQVPGHTRTRARPTWSSISWSWTGMTEGFWVRLGLVRECLNHEIRWCPVHWTTQVELRLHQIDNNRLQ